MEDQEVLFRNSPLDVYLQQVSAMEFSKYQPSGDILQDDIGYTKPNLEPSSHEEDTDENNGGSSSFFCQSDYIQNEDLLKCIFIFFESISLNDKDQHILSEIEKYVQKELVQISESTDRHADDTTFNYICTYKYYIAAAVLAFISFVIPWLYVASRFEEVFLLLLVIVGGACYLFFAPQNTNVTNNLMNQLIEFNQISEHFEQLVDKTIKHIKEVELVSNGYIKTVASLNSIKRTPNTTCKKLRQVLFDGCLNLFMTIRSRQRVLLQSNDFGQIDNAKDEYLAELPLDIFTDILEESRDEQHQYDEVQLERIKGMVCLYREQCSEFIYSSILTLHTLEHIDDTYKVKDILFACTDITRNLTKAANQLETKLNASLRLFFNHSDLPMISKPQIANENESVTKLFHSSKLYLHSALRRLDEMIELHDEVHDENKEQFISVVNQFYLLLENSKYCIDDIADVSKATNKSDESALDQSKQTNIKNENIENIKMFELPTEEIGDMLLEAESDGNLVKEQEDMNPDEIQASMKESRNSKKLMRELKCILSVKDSPSGLISFPLQPSSNETVDEEENIDEEENEPNRKKQRKYDATEYYSIEEENEAKFTLPSNFRPFIPPSNNMMNEETFGETDDSEDDDTEDCTNNAEQNIGNYENLNDEEQNIGNCENLNNREQNIKNCKDLKEGEQNFTNQNEGEQSVENDTNVSK